MSVQPHAGNAVRVADRISQVVVAGICPRPDPGELLTECLRAVARRPGRIPDIDHRGIRLSKVELAASAAPGGHRRIRLREDEPRPAPDVQVVAAYGEGLLERNVRAYGRKADDLVDLDGDHLFARLCA